MSAGLNEPGSGGASGAASGVPTGPAAEPLLTLAATTKPFEGHFGVIQRNAIGSWARLRPRPEILIFGDEPGAAELCEELGLTHVPEIARNTYDTPYLDDIFVQAQRLATTPYVCYVNADIILLQDFADAIGRLAELPREWLAVGPRWESRIADPLAFADGWDARLAREVRATCERAPRTAIDFFVFRSGFYSEIPRFLAGRPGFDWWLIYEARRRGAWVVDLHDAATAIHQWHPSGGVRGLQFHGFREEQEYNEALYEVPWANLWDASHMLTATGLRRLRLRRLLKPFWVAEHRWGVPFTRGARFLRRRAVRLVRALGRGRGRGASGTDGPS